jgi:hypothetical protein
VELLFGKITRLVLAQTVRGRERAQLAADGISFPIIDMLILKRLKIPLPLDKEAAFA